MMQYELQDTYFGYWIRKLFFWSIPSIHYNSPKQKRQISFLGILLPITLLALLFIIIDEILGGKASLLVIVANGLLGLALLFLYYWVSKGNIVIGGLLFLILAFGYVTTVLITLGTARNVLVINYLSIAIGAAILFDRKGFLIATLSILAVLAFLVQFENTQFPSPYIYKFTILQWLALGLEVAGLGFWLLPIIWQVIVHAQRQIADLEASPVPMVITDNEGNIEYVNSKYTQVMGYKLDELKMTKFLFHQLERLQPHNYSEVWSTISQGQEWHSEIQTQTKGGEIFYAAFSILPILDLTDKVSQFVITIKDISERKRIEAERFAMNRTREFATLYEITHDLGTFSDSLLLFETILNRTQNQLSISAGAIYLLDQNRLEFDLVRQIGVWQLDSQVSYDQWVSGTSPQIYTDASSIVRIPILYADECLGMLVLDTFLPNMGVPPTLNLNLYALLATQLALAIHNIRMFDRVRTSRIRAQTLAKEVLNAQEKERRLISRELHDEFGQQLTSVQLGLQDVARLAKQSNLQTKLTHIMGTVEHVLDELRHLSRVLRPSVLDDFGLLAALEWFIEQQSKYARFETEIKADEIERRLPEEIETVCFRVAQEAITNIVRHAQATKVLIELHRHDEILELIVQDNGVGFDLTSTMKTVTQGNSLGLLNMNERVELVGGRMQIETAPNQGTQIKVQIPLKSNVPVVERRVMER